MQIETTRTVENENEWKWKKWAKRKHQYIVVVYDFWNASKNSTRPIKMEFI